MPPLKVSVEMEGSKSCDGQYCNCRVLVDVNYCIVLDVCSVHVFLSGAAMAEVGTAFTLPRCQTPRTAQTVVSVSSAVLRHFCCIYLDT